MTRAHRITNLIVVVMPFLCFLAALVLLWNSFIGWTEVSVMLVMYVLTGLGITVGFHRLFTHRSFDTSRPVRYLFAVLGSMAVEGPVLAWVADHRKHHQFSDVEGDPHSPHVGGGNGFVAAAKNLFHAHVGWLFVSEGRAEIAKYVPDMLAERGMRFINRMFGEMYNLRAIASILVQLPIAEGASQRCGPTFQMPYTLQLPESEAAYWALHLDLISATDGQIVAQANNQAAYAPPGPTQIVKNRSRHSESTIYLAGS